ncbi:hypothetical protein BDV19DRAFT_374377 [Aspergillus venezuelensis]
MNSQGYFSKRWLAICIINLELGCLNIAFTVLSHAGDGQRSRCDVRHRNRTLVFL